MLYHILSSSKRWINNRFLHGLFAQVRTKHFLLVQLPALVVFSLATPAQAGEEEALENLDKSGSHIEARSACGSNEHWTFGNEFKKSIPLSMIDEFRSFLSKKTSNIRGFSEALALRSLATTDQTKVFSEYWISRALLDAGLVEIGVNGLNTLVAREITPERLPIQLAALRCIELVHMEHRALFLSDSALQRLPSYFQQKLKSRESLITLWEGATQLFLLLLEKNSSPKSLQAISKFLTGSGIYRTYVDAFLAVRKENYLEATDKLKTVLNHPELPKLIEQQRDHLKVMLGNLEYSHGAYAKSTELFKGVSKRSNELTSALIGLSWSHLQSGNYAEAIGLGVSVQSGWMRQTFIPEPLLVAAMSLNEICRYPESVRLVQILKREYKESFAWLKQFNDTPENKRPPLYPLAVRFLKKDLVKDESPTQIVLPPSRLMSEWIRSPEFLSYQEGINVLFDQKKSVKKWELSGQKEQRAQVLHLLQKAKKLRATYQASKLKTKPGARLPATLLAQFHDLRKEVTHLRRFERAAYVWKTILSNASPRIALTQKTWVHRIESDLAGLNRRMYETLGEVGENTDLIEVEINNGASDDIIRQNAQAGVGKSQTSKKTKTRELARSSGDVYQWGESISTLTGTGEIWEDELDSLKANLIDQCATVEPRKKKKKDE